MSVHHTLHNHAHAPHSQTNLKGIGCLCFPVSKQILKITWVWLKKFIRQDKDKNKKVLDHKKNLMILFWTSYYYFAQCRTWGRKPPVRMCSGL